MGPTASGKTALLDEAFGSPRAREAAGLPEAEVVSADSMQAYRGMDIGTAKPDPALLSRLPHRLIDVLEIEKQYTAGDFVRLADEACADIASRGKLPIVSGGTGFYVRNFVCGLPAAPPADPELRAAVAADLALRGSEAMRAELAVLDPDSSARIHPNDIYRITRALEVVRATGRPMADFAASKLPRSGYSFLVLGVERPREELRARIAARTAAMMAAGLAEEVARLRRAGHGPGEPGMQAIGYREFFAYGLEPSPGELSAAALAVERDTISYAKRQMTFFRALPGIEWIAPEAGLLAEAARGLLAAGR